MARRLKKKRLIPLSGVVPCFSHTAAALAGLTGKEADEKILKAALADARETLAAVFRALLSDLEADDTARERIVQILTCMGWVGAAYPYAPGKVTGKDEARAKERSRLLRKRLVQTGWVGFEKSYRRIFGTGAEARLGKEDRKTWNYLCKRKDQMDYGRWRKEGLVIGSGSVETACKLLIGARLAGPGMRWRFQNGLCIAALRAAVRSHLKIAA